MSSTWFRNVPGLGNTARDEGAILLDARWAIVIVALHTDLISWDKESTKAMPRTHQSQKTQTKSLRVSTTRMGRSAARAVLPHEVPRLARLQAGDAGPRRGLQLNWVGWRTIVVVELEVLT